MHPEPKRITVDGSTVTLSWPDGGETRVDGRELRRACPCAACREFTATASDPGPASRYAIAGAGLVGGYAVRFTFGDGHADGIYPYRVLRDISTSVDEPPA